VTKEDLLPMELSMLEKIHWDVYNVALSAGIVNPPSDE
jgi:hypothetical protein